MVNENNLRVSDGQPSQPAILKSGSGVLRPRARILRTFGDELISSETVAIIELVKNSYDADATRVVVRFNGPIEVGCGKIEVIDNGHGMSLETIQTTWMEPATLMRRKERRSLGRNRRVLGEKGIGRFATSRLADFLEVVTRCHGAQREARAYFDWGQFDAQEKYLDQIEVLWEEAIPTDICPRGTVGSLWHVGEEPSSTDLTHGTILRMEGLRSNWGEPQFADLRTKLARLVSPFFGEELSSRRDQFELRLDLPHPFEHLAGPIEPSELLRNPHYVLRGTVDADGAYDVTIRLRDSDNEETILGTFLPNSHKPRCGPIELELRIWDRDASSLRDLAGRYSFESVAQVRRQLDEIAGISIYRDGFRVLPYGEGDNDWLRLDLRRVQNPTLRLSNNQILGYVLVSSEANPELRDQSNREGLIEIPPLDDLRQLIRMALNELESRRYDIRHPPSSRPSPRSGGLFLDLDLATVRNYVVHHYPDDKQLTNLVGDAERDLEARSHAIQDVVARYQRLAFLGQLIDIVLHDGRAPLTKIGNEALLGSRDAESSIERGDSVIKKLLSRFEMIETQSDALGTVFRRIEPFGGRKPGRPRSVLLEDVISDACAVLDSEVAEVGARLDTPQTTTSVTVDQSEIQRVIINLLQNSLHWLRQVPRDRRKVVVEVRRNGPEEVEVVFSDSGPGVRENVRDRIFDPYFSTKPDGIGLGLTIAGEVITDYYAGVFELLESGPLEGACFRFTLCRRV